MIQEHSLYFPREEMNSRLQLILKSTQLIENVSNERMNEQLITQTHQE